MLCVAPRDVHRSEYAFEEFVGATFSVVLTAVEDIESKDCRSCMLRQKETALTPQVDMFSLGCNHWHMVFRRSVLLVALACLLLNALDCFGAGLMNAQARKCCASGHCSPRNLDSCCKASPTGANQALVLHPNVSVQKPVQNIDGLNLVPVHVYATLRLCGIRAGSDDHPPPQFSPNNGLLLRI